MLGAVSEGWGSERSRWEIDWSDGSSSVEAMNASMSSVTVTSAVEPAVASVVFSSISEPHDTGVMSPLSVKICLFCGSAHYIFFCINI